MAIRSDVAKITGMESPSPILSQNSCESITQGTRIHTRGIYFGNLPAFQLADASLRLAVNMGGAMATHLRRKEYPMAAGNLVLLALAAFVMYGRLVVVPL